jgi:predicted double-glycine peptidase
MKKSWVICMLCLLLVISYHVGKSTSESFPISHEIKDFPLFAQPDSVSCGPSSLKMLLQKYGKNLKLEEIRKKTKTDYYVKDDVRIGGTTPKYMEIALNFFDVSAKMMTIDINDLKWYVSQNRPPVALVRSDDKYWHWIVVIGYTKDEIIMADPGGGKRKVLSIEKFENAWNFTSDLSGTNLTKNCPVCNGSGKINNLGPFGICDWCGGSGRVPDWYWILVELGEVKGYIVIVPNEPFSEN